MSYRKIDLGTFPRREHFQYFLMMANPYVGVTVVLLAFVTLKV